MYKSYSYYDISNNDAIFLDKFNWKQFLVIL